MGKSDKNSKLVYSTEGPLSSEEKRKDTGADKTGKTFYLKRETKGRRGKTVTSITVSGWSEQALSELAAELKKFCGSGGSVKEGIIIIQGDQRQKIVPFLRDKGFAVKLAGG